ncbi:MAG: L,D-transpeptidase YcbB [Sphingomonadales bacterium]|jgi:murein L,D-transpeptidase YcbB/YkuD|nr:L,D-transpeptidase YcbB [Sphingomonadales bacterium]
MRKILACVSLAALLAGGCDFVKTSGGGGGASSGQVVQVDPKAVTPADLQAAVSDPRVKQFYEARGWQAVWTGERAQELNAAFDDAARHAIDAKSYAEHATKGASAAEREAGLTLAAIEYGQALATGAIDPRKLFEVYTVPMSKADVVGGLGKAVEQGGVRPWLASLAPQDAEYKALSDAYLAYRQKAGQEHKTAIAAGEQIKPGKRDPRVAQIREGLRANGYLAPAAAPAGEAKAGKAKAPAAPASGGDVYGADMVAAVKKVQSDYGIEADGVIGNSTIEALNTGARDRARILAVNLERRRWLDRAPPATRIDVNTAAAELHYFKDGAEKDRRRVVVGQPDWETPELGSPIARLVANPPWTIPDSIAEKEIRPKGAAYMAKENIVMKNGRLVQESGPKSALGLVKFDMINNQQIYLHDTPAKALFASTQRHASHGCSRVENAVEFARLLAQDDGKLDAFDKAMATKEETPVELSNKIPVRLLYHSAYVDGGRVVFRTDPYAWDDKVAAALGLGGPVRPRVKVAVEDVGP